jgi:predicted transcriptional regulator
MKQRILKGLTVRFEEPTRTALEEIAQREHRTLSDQVRHFVETAIERQQQREQAA